MSKNYTHLSLDQRYQIEALLKTGIKQKEIASIVNVHPSTVSFSEMWDPEEGE